MKKGILLCYHGTRERKGINDTKKLTKIFKKKNSKYLVRTGYLEITKPSIEKQLNFFFKKNIVDINVIPAMIFSGGHVLKDIPEIIKKFKNKNKSIKITIRKSLLNKKNFLSLIKTNLSEFIYNKKKDFLIVVASNTISTIAKTQIKQIKSNLTRHFKFKNSAFFLIGSDSNSLKQKIINLNKQTHCCNFIVVPIFLFRGRLLQNCKKVRSELRKRNKNINYYLAPHINNYHKISQLIKI